MRKLPAVEDARAVMTEGMEWGVWTWLLEKKRVREIADKARAALDELETKVKATWSDDLKIAYNQLVSKSDDAKPARQQVTTLNQHGSKRSSRRSKKRRRSIPNSWPHSSG